jgi:hypothetical protein
LNRKAAQRAAFLFTAIADQKISWFGFDRKALSVFRHYYNNRYSDRYLRRLLYVDARISYQKLIRLCFVGFV